MRISIYLFICNLFNGWRIRYNTELDRLISEADVVRFIKALRIKCLGHVQRMDT
jgi:hypothetical protein